MLRLHPTCLGVLMHTPSGRSRPNLRAASRVPEAASLAPSGLLRPSSDPEQQDSCSQPRQGCGAAAAPSILRLVHKAGPLPGSNCRSVKPDHPRRAFVSRRALCCEAYSILHTWFNFIQGTADVTSCMSLGKTGTLTSRHHAMFQDSWPRRHPSSSVVCSQRTQPPTLPVSTRAYAQAFIFLVGADHHFDERAGPAIG